MLKISPSGARVLRGEVEADLLGSASRPSGRRKPARRNLEKVALLTEEPTDAERRLFERLRGVRRAMADERNVPAFMILSDSTLRALARLRPKTREDLLRVPGIGPVKAETFGPRLLEAIRAQAGT